MGDENGRRDMDKTPNPYVFFLNGHNPENDSLACLALKDFRDRSGLSAETLERAQVSIFSGNADKLKKRLGFGSINGQSILTVARLVEIPSFSHDGKISAYHYRLYPAIEDCRYLHPKGNSARPYILPEVWAFKDKPHKPVWITEGAKKVLKLVQHGRAAIGLQGVWNFRGGSESIESFLFRDLEEFMWRGRTAYLGFDADLWTNPQVRFALFELAFKLMSRGAVIRFPKWKGAKGIDDYLAGQEALDKELEGIEEKAFPLERFVKAEHRDEIIRALSITHAAMDDLTREVLVNLIAKGFHIRAKWLYAEIARQTPTNARQVIEENVLIVHPSYEINADFMSLGFKETVIVDNTPIERNFYVIATQDGFTVHDTVIFPVGEYKLVFNERDKVLMTVSDKWDKAKLTAFIKDHASPQGVYHEIKAILNAYIEFQNEAHYGLVAIWTIATYFHRCFNAFPFLFFFGKKQTGKSRALDLLKVLCFNAIKVKGISVASLGDSVDAVRATFLMDQAEVLSDKKNLELLGILADSYTIGGGRRRIVNITNKSRRVMEFETYSPKAFASIRELDPDIKDRCIEIIMIRAEKEYPYPEPFLPAWKELRDMLYRLLLTKWQEVRAIYPQAGLGVKQRVRELWRPLDTILILENVPEEERQAIRNVFLESMLETQAGLTDLEYKLFETLKELLQDKGTAVLTVTDIVEKMAMPEGEKFSKRNQTKWVGRNISKLNLFSGREGRKNNKHSYLFTAEHVDHIFNRYQTDGIDSRTAKDTSSNGSQSPDKKDVSAENGSNGRGKAEDTSTDADTANHCQEPNSNGRQGSLDNQQDCHYADLVIDLTEEEKDLLEKRAAKRELRGD